MFGIVLYKLLKYLTPELIIFRLWLTKYWPPVAFKDILTTLQLLFTIIPIVEAKQT